MKNSLKSMVLGLVLAVAAMGFAVAMPLAVQSFTRLTSEHQNNRVAETDPSPKPLVTPDTSSPEEIVLPEPRDESGAPGDAEGRESSRTGEGDSPDAEAGMPRESKDKKAKEGNAGGQGKGRGQEQGGPKEPQGPKDKGPQDKGPKPEPPADPDEPKEPKEPEGPPPGDEGDGDDDSPGKSGEHREDEPETDADPAPAEEESSEDDSSKGKGKGKALGLTSAPGNREAAPGLDGAAEETKN